MIDFKRFFTMSSAQVTDSDEPRDVAAKPFRGLNWGSFGVPAAITQWENEGGRLPPTALAMTGVNHAGDTATKSALNANVAISDALPLGVLITDVYGNCVYSNAAYERLSGCKQANLLGSHWVSFLHPDDRDGLVREWQEAMRQLRPFISEARLVRTDGSVLWVRQTITVVNESRLEYGHAHIIEDLSATRKYAAAQRARQQDTFTRSRADNNALLAGHDNLTGLPSRIALNERFIQARALARRHDTSMALLFIGLDNVKEVNDRLGHESGDRLLISLASRLLASVRATDTVCRYGGDEFVILLSEISHPDHAAEVAAKLHAAVAGQMQHDGQAIELSLSVGVSVFPDDGQNAAMLLQKAEAAMHQAKARGKNCTCTATADK